MDKLDILNRDEFVEQLVRLIENISSNKITTCFAINGAWGCGKSFVLSMFEKQLSMIQSEETFNEKYFIVHYNCWKYDYYEEPLIAIVSSILAEIDRKTKIIPDSERKSKAIGVLKSTSEALLSAGNIMVKAKTGIDFKNGFETIFKGLKSGSEDYGKKHEHDKYFRLNIVIDTLSESLQKIAEEYTVVIIVDELDRCLPEYAIKVLERLHHLTEEKDNIITVVAVDKEKLLKSIDHIFGFASAEEYLKKFINFEVTLDNGDVSERITEKYSEYLDLFDTDIIPFDDSIEEYMQIIFKNIAPRTQEELVRRAMLIHKLLYTDKKDYSFMIVELLAVIMYYMYGYKAFMNTKQIAISSFDRVFVPYSNSPNPPFAEFFSKKFNDLKFDITYSKYANEPSIYVLPEVLSLPSAILFTWYLIHDKRIGMINLQYTKGGVYELLIENVKEIKKFVETLKIIK